MREKEREIGTRAKEGHRERGGDRERERGGRGEREREGGAQRWTAREGGVGLSLMDVLVV